MANYTVKGAQKTPNCSLFKSAKQCHLQTVVFRGIIALNVYRKRSVKTTQGNLAVPFNWQQQCIITAKLTCPQMLEKVT